MSAHSLSLSQRSLFIVARKSMKYPKIPLHLWGLTFKVRAGLDIKQLKVIGDWELVLFHLFCFFHVLMSTNSCVRHLSGTSFLPQCSSVQVAMILYIENMFRSLSCCVSVSRCVFLFLICLKAPAESRSYLELHVSFLRYSFRTFSKSFKSSSYLLSALCSVSHIGNSMSPSQCTHHTHTHTLRLMP